MQIQISKQRIQGPIQMNLGHLATALVATICWSNILSAQADVKSRAATILSEQQWEQVDASVHRGLDWLATRQQSDGSFESIDLGQPAVTSFCLMAFLSQGESPVDGKYKQQLTKAIDFIADQQKPNGLLAVVAPQEVPIPRSFISSLTSARARMGVAAAYNHAISGLALSEAYGQCSPEQSKRLTPVLEKAVAATLQLQRWPKDDRHDEGGWRYLTEYPGSAQADLSVSGWQLMFLRSAKNAGFDVPDKSIDAAVKYVGNCFLKEADLQVHTYEVGRIDMRTRATAGAGVLALAHAGKNGSQEAIASGEWILKHDFSDYNQVTAAHAPQIADRYHYGAVVCSQAMFQLGGKYWKQFFPPLVNALLKNQKSDGSWPPEQRDQQFGNCYSTALSVLALSVPDQILPIFQR